MIRLLAAGDSDKAAALVYAALIRSVPTGLVESVSASALYQADASQHIWVLVNPADCWSDRVLALLQSNAKVVVFGILPPGLVNALQVVVDNSSQWRTALEPAVQAGAAPAYGTSESAARVVYREDLAGVISPLLERAFCRYDYAREWNNLGYGAITLDDSPWSLAQFARVRDRVGLAEVVAEVVIGNEVQCTYAALWDQVGSLLWYARAVGPSDSQEWRLVEVFLAHHRGNELPCAPVIREIPAGYDVAVTMRLDCDEDVESARALWQVYGELDVPLSLALHAAVLSDSRHHKLAVEVLESGGSLLSHTLTHAPNWGGSYQAALHEGLESRAIIEAATGHRVRHAVSPFHHTPDYARKALADAGYEGCVGGIICNDPDFMTARAGLALGQGQGFIGFPQQCMLHGHCMLAGDDPLAVFKQAFLAACQSGQFFGYLDHPFSPRYQYDWDSEPQRIQAHQDFIGFMREQGGKVLFAKLADAFDFLAVKNSVQVNRADQGIRLLLQGVTPNGWQVECEYRGQRQIIGHDGVLL